MSKRKTRQLRLTICEENYKKLKALSPMKKQMHFVLDMILTQYFERKEREKLQKNDFI